jgi:predicted nucleotidyltransferase
MPIPESKFNDWHGTGADKGSADARDKTRRALMSERSPLEQADEDYEVYLQGSYANTTHTRGSSDVDVVAKITSAWRSDLEELSEEEEERYNDDHDDADYDHRDFYDDVLTALRIKFGHSAVTPGNKAIKIDKEKTSLLDVDVDVVACGEYRVYRTYPESGDEDAEIDKGMHFMPQYDNDRVINFPKIHRENGREMHSNYKETVRIFKNARYYYNNHFDTLWTIDAHSYGIECLIYNVPESILKRTSRSDRFDETLSYLDNADFSTFDQVSEMESLFGDSNTQWSTDEADELITRLREMWDDWYSKRKNAQLFH